VGRLKIEAAVDEYRNDGGFQGVVQNLGGIEDYKQVIDVREELLELLISSTVV
jgi:hypothetical protein